MTEPNGWRWLYLTAVVVLLDQLAKEAVLDSLVLHESIRVLPVLNITLMYNTGAAFSFLADGSGWQRWLFTALAIGIAVAILVWLRQLKALEAHRLPLFPGVGDLLRDLARRGVPRAIVSSDAEANIRTTLGPEHARLIDHFACGAGLFGKPPLLRRVLRHYRLRPDEALYVGDELRDAEAARAVGVAFGAVTWGFTTVDALKAQGPDRVFTSVAEIAPALG